ncbi:MAG TPA: hypothetical protein VKY74_20900, partial [Chloroflexia bacterium]|nr:hypothetical protein [Chloroflexia bacterium]
MNRRHWLSGLAAAGLLILLGIGAATQSALARPADPLASSAAAPGAPQMVAGHSYHNDTSPPLRDMPQLPIKPSGQEREASANPPIGNGHKDALDTVVQRAFGPLAVPTPILNFDGIPFPGVVCNCAPPDTDGEVGATQYVQMVNEGYQVFNKATGGSVLGPASITSIWTGFGGACETGGKGDPVVLYDQLANRWVISQFATATGGNPITDECLAVSTTNDATGSYNRYGFHLGSNFFDYPKLSVWPDAYYMGDNVFAPPAGAYLGPQPFAFDRTRMLSGLSATFVSTAGPLGTGVNFMLPGDLDGSILPPAGAPNPFLAAGAITPWPLYKFHVDFITPANSTFTTANSVTPAAFTQLCSGTRNCVPEVGGEGLDGLGDRGMFRSAYRRFADGHEALVGNMSVSSGGVAGVRWWEINNITSGTPGFVQQSTLQPDTDWRWMGSTAMDTLGDMALGYSASSATINP